MAASHHFEKRKITITQLPFEMLSPNMARWYTWMVRNVPETPLLTCSKSQRWRPTAILKNEKSQ